MNNLESTFKKALSPVESFISSQTSGGILLIVATVSAVVIANSPWSSYYFSMLDWNLGFTFKDTGFELTLHHWVNDGFMVILFFLLGLEIKREFMVGELSDIKQSSTIIAAALGGMVVPALFYIMLNSQGSGLQGWGIPMATDTAFVLGLLALLRNHISNSAKVFLVGLAIIDDIGAVLVIALFYSNQLDFNFLGLASTFFIGLIFINILGVRNYIPYIILSILLWYAVYKSGVHGTVAGILAAMTVPARPRKSAQSFANASKKLIRKFEQRAANSNESVLSSRKNHELIEEVEENAKLTSTPLQRWESALESPVNLGIIPVFAFFNAGITLDKGILSTLSGSTISLGIILGLFLGKPLGIIGMTFACVKLNIGSLPENLNMNNVIGIGLLAGMGFTMSLFIANLGLGHLPGHLLEAKLAILTATLLSGISGMAWLYFTSVNLEKFK